MKVIYHDSFTQVYTHDPAAEPGRMEAIVAAIRDRAVFVEATPASREQILLAHTRSHLDRVAAQGLCEIAALAAGGAIQAATIGLDEPAFGLIRPPGHHASAGSSWGFCYFNNMAISVLHLKQKGLIRRAMVLDIDLHFGDGTVNILSGEEWVEVHNPSARDRQEYLKEVEGALASAQVDIIGISAGFDFHQEDWGGLLTTEDYEIIGRRVRETGRASGGGCFAILEGGYNHRVLGVNAAALLEGLAS